MTSSMRIEFDFNHQEPYIKVNLNKESGDMRDKMLQHFFEMVGVNTTIGIYYEKELNKYGYTEIRLFPLNSKIDHEIYPPKAVNEIPV